MKVQILAEFRRFVPAPESTAERPLELREDYPAGKTVDVSDEDAHNWIAKGLAKAVDAAPAE